MNHCSFPWLKRHFSNSQVGTEWCTIINNRDLANNCKTPILGNIIDDNVSSLIDEDVLKEKKNIISFINNTLSNTIY